MAVEGVKAEMAVPGKAEALIDPETTTNLPQVKVEEDLQMQLRVNLVKEEEKAVLKVPSKDADPRNNL